MAGTVGLAKTSSTKIGKPPRRQQRPRRRTVFPKLPRADREAAVQEILTKFPAGGRELLLFARASAVAARRIDFIIRAYEWAVRFRERFAAAEWPRPVPPHSWMIRVSGPNASGEVDMARLADAAYEAHRYLDAVVSAATALVPLLDHPASKAVYEAARNSELMAGAASLRFASDRGFRLDPHSLALVAIAIGLEARDDDYKKAWHRWHKRLPRLRRLMKSIELDDADTWTFEAVDFYGPL